MQSETLTEMEQKSELTPTGRPRGRLVKKGALSITSALALVLAFAAVVWACTPIVEDFDDVHRLIHDGPTGSSASSLFLNVERIGNYPVAAGETLDIHQNNDGTGVVIAEGDTAGCTTSGTVSGVEDPIVGSITYDSEGKGSGTATVTPINGAGTYEICTFPGTKGYVTFW